MGDWNAQRRAGCGASERRVEPLWLDVHEAAGEPERPIAQKRAGHETGLRQNLEAVADPQDVTAGGRELRDAAHYRREASDHARSKVVAVGEAARQDHSRDALQVGRLVPEPDRLHAGDGQGVERVDVRVRVREDDDTDPHDRVTFAPEPAVELEAEPAVETADEVASRSSMV